MYSAEKAAGTAWEGEVAGARGPRKRRGEGRQGRRRERGNRNVGAKQKERGLGRDPRREAEEAPELEENVVALWENLDLGTPVKSPEVPRITPAKPPTPSGGGSRAPALTAAAVLIFAALMFMAAKSFGLLKPGGPPVPQVSGEGKEPPLDFKLEDALRANLPGAATGGGDDAKDGEGGQDDIVDFIGSLFGSLDDEDAESSGEEDGGGQPEPSEQPEPVPEPVPSGAGEGEQGPLDVGESPLSPSGSLKDIASLVLGDPLKHTGRSSSLSDMRAGGVGKGPETRPRRSSAPGDFPFEGTRQAGMAPEGRGQEGLAPEAPPLPQGGEEEPEPSPPEPTPEEPVSPPPEPTPQEPVSPPAPSESPPHSPSRIPPPKPPRSKLLGYKMTPDAVDVGSVQALRRDSSKRRGPPQSATLPRQAMDEGQKETPSLRRRASAPPGKPQAPTEHHPTPPKARVDVPFTGQEPTSVLSESVRDRGQQGVPGFGDPWVPRSRSNSLGDTIPSPSPDPLPPSEGGGGEPRYPGPRRTRRIRPGLPWQQEQGSSGGADPKKKAQRTPSWLHHSPYSLAYGGGAQKPGEAAGDAHKATQQQSSKWTKGKKKKRGTDTV